MIPDFRFQVSDWPALRRISFCSLTSACRAVARRRRVIRQSAVALCVGGCLLFAAGCSTVSRRAPGRTVVEVKATVLPARIISNFFVIESKQEDGRVYRFLVDTGSTVSYVSPALAKLLAVKPKKGAGP